MLNLDRNNRFDAWHHSSPIFVSLKRYHHSEMRFQGFYFDIRVWTRRAKHPPLSIMRSPDAQPAAAAARSPVSKRACLIVCADPAYPALSNKPLLIIDRS